MDTPLLHLPSTTSTNEDAYGLARKGAVHGCGVLADTQSGGRGRLGREWLSPPGSGLYCSIILRPRLPFTDFPKLTLTAGLAVCRVIETLVPHAPFGLKWPNDLYCRGCKAGGILVESSSPVESDDNIFVIVGIGLNVNSRKSDLKTVVNRTPTSLYLESGEVYDIEELYQAIHISLMRHVKLHEEEGLAVILEEWRKRDLLLGIEMQWLTHDRKVITGVGLGPDDSGQLLARDSGGTIHQILSGDVTMAGS